MKEHNVEIGDNVYIHNAIIGDDSKIKNNVTINKENVVTPQYVNKKICTNDLSLVGCNITIGENVNIGKLSMIVNDIKEEK